ncbi:MAG TPA: hypothetical protein V6C99_03940 [Oculatellaceae cyanobacterium]|jgi:hypothetical protein
MLSPMPYAVSHSPVSSPRLQNKPPHRQKVRFGFSEPKGLTPQQLQTYQDTISKSFPELSKKYGRNIDMKDGYSRLFYEMRKRVDQTVKVVSPQDIVRYKERGLFGTVEESADAMFELWALRAVQKGWITPEKTQHWADVLTEYRQKKLPYESYFERIQSELSESDVENFQEMTGLPSTQAKQMLALISGKFGQFQVDYPNFDMKEHLAPLLQDEINELFENKQGFSLSKTVLSAVGWAYSRISLLPVRVFDKLMLGYVNYETQMPLEFHDITPLTWYKTVNRQHMQYMHYYDPNKPPSFQDAYNLRKAQYKPFELLLEAGILKGAERKAQRSKMNVIG